MGNGSRRKGAGGEREVVALLRDHLGVVVDRKLGQARDGGEDISLPPFRIEVKRRARIATLRHLDQARRGARPDEVPMVVLREDRGTWAVLIDFDQWVRLAREDIVNGAP